MSAVGLISPADCKNFPRSLAITGVHVLVRKSKWDGCPNQAKITLASKRRSLVQRMPVKQHPIFCSATMPWSVNRFRSTSLKVAEICTLGKCFALAAQRLKSRISVTLRQRCVRFPFYFSIVICYQLNRFYYTAVNLTKDSSLHDRGEEAGDGHSRTRKP